MIFALVLTILYAIYYGVVITRDLQGKKGRTNPAEEVFDLEDMENEETVEVRESEDGFQVGGGDAEQPESPVKTETEAPTEETAESENHAVQEKAERIRSNLAEADIDSENGVDAPALHELLEGKRETLFKPEMTITRNEI